MPRKVFELPIAPPRLPDKLPGEDAVSRGVDHVLNLMEKDPILGLVNRLVDKIPVITERQYATPFGTMKTPEFYVPRLTPARFEGEKREAFKAAVMQDVASLLGLIPGAEDVAQPILDAIYDTASAKIQDTLNPEELRFFRSYNKADPSSTVAIIRAMVRTQKER